MEATPALRHLMSSLYFFFFSDSLPPRPPLWLQDMLMQLRKKGPSTEGVFRKTCNNKNMRDVREQLNSGLEVDLEAQPVLLLVGLLKVGLASACVVQCVKLPPTTKRHVAGAQTQKSFDGSRSRGGHVKFCSFRGHF